MTFFELIRNSLLDESRRMKLPGTLVQAVLNAVQRKKVSEPPAESVGDGQ